MSKIYFIKIFNSIVKKYKKNKICSSYNVIRSFSDEMSDKTSFEILNPSNQRNKISLYSNYDKRDNSLDIIRNDDHNYEVVLPYQRIVKSYV